MLNGTSYLRNSICKERHRGCQRSEESGLPGGDDGMRQSFLNCIQVLQVPGLFERIQVHKHVVHSNSDNHKQGDNVQNPDCFVAKYYSIHKEGEWEGRQDGHYTKQRRENREPGQEKHQNKNGSQTAKSETVIVLNRFLYLIIKYQGSTIEDFYISVENRKESGKLEGIVPKMWRTGKRTVNWRELFPKCGGKERER